MHDLIPLGAGSLTTAEIDAAMAYAAAEKAPATRALYATDWRDFSLWCGARLAATLPAHPGIVASYLSDLAQAGRKASTIARKAAAIAHHHKLAGHEPPTAFEGVKAVLRGIRRTLGTAPARKAPATADVVGQMLDLCAADHIIGLRDRALLALGFAGAFRRSELVALQVEDLVEVADGLRVLIRRSKTDQTGEGHEIAIPRGCRLRPVEAVQAWLAAAGITEGPVFRSVLKGGRVQPGRLPGRFVAAIVKRYATRAGLDPAAYAGHSLRAGMITSAAEHGASVFKIQEVSRHKSINVLSGYVRRANLFDQHAGAAFL